MAYDEKLARQILIALDDKFPTTISSDALKIESPDFKQASQEDWALALDGLLRLGDIQGRDIRAGYGNVLQGIHNLTITPLGKEKLHPSLTWKAFYWKWLDYFGREFSEKRRGKLASAAVGTIVGFLAGHNSEAWMNWKQTAAGTLLGIGAWTFVDFVRVPWLIQSEPVSRDQDSRHIGFTVLGASVLVVMVVSLVYLTSPLWMPKRHRYAIHVDDDYVGLTNANQAFKFLATAAPNCRVRMTAPPQNREVVQILSKVAGNFCQLDVAPDPVDLDNDVLAGSVDDAVVVHVAKQPSTKDGFITALGNVLSVRLKHDSQLDFQPDLVWIQVGRGYVWRKDTGEAGTVK